MGTLAGEATLPFSFSSFLSEGQLFKKLLPCHRSRPVSERFCHEGLGWGWGANSKLQNLLPFAERFEFMEVYPCTFNCCILTGVVCPGLENKQ